MVRMAQLSRDGESLRRIAGILTEEGHRTKRRAKGHAQPIARRLSAPSGLATGRIGPETATRSDRLRRMEDVELQARSGLTRIELVLWGRSLHRLLLHPTRRFSGILERNGPVGAGRFVAAYCLQRLALYLSGLIFLVIWYRGLPIPIGAVIVLLLLTGLCIILSGLHARTAQAARREYRQSFQNREPDGSASGT